MLHLQARQISKSDSEKSQHWNVAARADNERKRTLTAKMGRSPAIFSAYTPATTQQCLVKSSRDPGVVSLHVNAGHFPTTARRVTSPTLGTPPPCKQALNRRALITKLNSSAPIDIFQFLDAIIYAFLSKKDTRKRVFLFVIMEEYAKVLAKTLDVHWEVLSLEARVQKSCMVAFGGWVLG